MIDLDFYLSIPVTIIYVGILYWFLSKFFFGPVTRIMAERREAIEGSLEAAARRIAEVETKTAEYETVVREARSEAYKHQETIRDGAVEERARLLADARSEADAIIAEARSRLGRETTETRRRLEDEIDALALSLSDTLLQD